MDLGLIAGVVGAVATVAAAILAYMQLKSGKPVPQPWPEIKPPNDTSVHTVTARTDEHDSSPPKPTPSAADFGLSVKVRMERMPTYVRGRKPLLRHLRRHFTQGGLVVLTGSGGMGKSTVARQLVRELPVPVSGQEEVPVWEVSAADLPSLTGGLITIAAALGASESDLQAISSLTPVGPDRFWGLLEQRAKGWLLIIDNADQVELLAAPAAQGTSNVPRLHDGTGWVRATRRGLVLVTSRKRETRRPDSLRNKSNRNVIWPDDAVLYEVGPLSDSEAGKVLYDLAPMAGELKQAEKLGHRLGGLPLALRLAGQYLSYVSKASFTAYLQALDSDPKMIELIDLAAPEHVEREMVMFTWELSLNALADDGIPQARAMLRLVSCYASAVPIPLSLFTSELFIPLLRSSHNLLSSLVEASIRIDRGLQGLYHLGLIDPAASPSQEAGGASSGRPEDRRLLLDNKNALIVHPVIADTNRAYLLKSPSDPDSLLVCQTAVNLLANVLDGLEEDEPTDWPNFRLFTPHLQALLDLQALLVKSRGSLPEEALDILVRVTGHTAMAFGQMRSPEFGLDLVTSALSYVSQRADDPTSGIVIARQQLAHLLDQLGRPAKAETIYRNVLEAQRRLWPYDDPAILATRSNIAGTVGSQQGRSGQAIAAFKDLLKDERRVFGEDDRNTLTTRLQLATLMCRNEEEWREAEDALRSLLADMGRVLGQDDRTTFVARHNLAQIILRQGRRTEAEVLFGDLLADERRVLGDDHYLTVATSNFSDGTMVTTSQISTPKIREEYAARQFSKGVVLGQQGQPDQALEVCRQLIDRFGDDSDPIRETLAHALLYQSAILADLQRPAEALVGLERAVRLYEELAAADPDTAREGLDSARQLLAEVRGLAAQAMLDRAVTLGQQQPSQAIEAFQQLIDRFGDDPDLREIVATALFNKAVTLARQDRTEEEIEAFQQLIDRFGDDPDPTIRALAAKALLNKGIALGQQEPDQAIEAFQQLIDRFGNDPAPDLREIVATALFNKAVTLGQQQPDQAIEAYQELIDRFGNDRAPALREIVAKAMHNKRRMLPPEERME